MTVGYDAPGTPGKDVLMALGDEALMPTNEDAPLAVGDDAPATTDVDPLATPGDAALMFKSILALYSVRSNVLYRHHHSTVGRCR